jgi:hypothetical protein
LASWLMAGGMVTRKKARRRKAMDFMPPNVFEEVDIACGHILFLRMSLIPNL